MTRSDVVEQALRPVHRMLEGGIPTCRVHAPDYDGPLDSCVNVDEWAPSWGNDRACRACRGLMVERLRGGILPRGKVPR